MRTARPSPYPAEIIYYLSPLFRVHVDEFGDVVLEQYIVFGVPYQLNHLLPACSFVVESVGASSVSCYLSCQLLFAAFFIEVVHVDSCEIRVFPAYSSVTYEVGHAVDPKPP